MTGAPEPAHEIPSIPRERTASLGEAAGQAFRATQDALRSDEGIVVLGLGGGALAGASVAILAEGMRIHPSGTDKEAALRNSQGKDGSPPMVEANTVQFGTIAGSMVLSTLVAVAYTRFRRNRS